jgi:hypothetical protein
LSQAKLPAQDLSRIVTEFIPKADIATLPIFPGSAVFAAAWICWKPLFNRTPAWFPDLKLIECVPNPAP